MMELLQTGRGYQQDRDRLYGEVRVLKKLRHKNIMSFYDSWVDDENQVINFVTELFTSGDLRQYRKKHKHVESVALKKWAWQILQGLVYLHGHNPPIIHRDLKSDNIFVQGTTGTLKIGDLGLATLMRSSSATQSVLGTPEYMAPEFYEERYDQKVDIYSYGMCILELATMEYPYKECTNPAQIYRRVTQGIHPEAMQKVQDQELRRFIELCICHNPQFRPEARELLKNSFFDEIKVRGIGSEPFSQPSSPPQSGKQSPNILRAQSDAGDHQFTSDEESHPEIMSKTRPASPIHSEDPQHHLSPPNTDTAAFPMSIPSHYTNGNSHHPHHQQYNNNNSTQHNGLLASPFQMVGTEAEQQIAIPNFNEGVGQTLNKLPTDIRCRDDSADHTYQVKCRQVIGRMASFKLNLPRDHGEKRAVCFDFDVDEDTPERVAQEMVQELSLRAEDTQVIAGAVKRELERVMDSVQPNGGVYDSVQSEFERR
eukprot:TRINITY_DN8934_c0_g1_i4.p1 TRINITY_DN8934_c0_g1~~TRINITY_DN8934_c0_g1_i4.p1  ORF type:complete len:483 (-),score=61.89 TRINITY_DN8934_c0_g1_i4:2013-3461(-)